MHDGVLEQGADEAVRGLQGQLNTMIGKSSGFVETLPAQVSPTSCLPSAKGRPCILAGSAGKGFAHISVSETQLIMHGCK